MISQSISNLQFEILKLYSTNPDEEELQELKKLLFLEPSNIRKTSSGTARQLLQSGLIGIWKDRNDINDSAVYARQLREKAQRRDNKQ
jgi:hypothetical protein